MSYRKIVVNSKEYLYSVGKTHTKIRGVGAYLNEQVGWLVPRGDCYALETDDAVIRVTPASLAEFIKSNKL